MMGGDPNEAARNVDAIDQQLQDGVGTALTGREEPAPADPPPEPAPAQKNAPPFDGHTQALAGILMAQDEQFKRDGLALDDRLEAVRLSYDAAIKAAENAYKLATDAAVKANVDAEDQINAERRDLDRARDGIKALVAALT